eukprot:NODE_11929_length_1257_cov_3.430973.p1 GENE.NODE_11929_length_1257_cov_3.430973~~NODE_11929_length_1257_cov_3.430973.p1  ORF type:complete len:379 (+),score=119.71 NODE_11929_length_1257_cov_3.430973:2-1138(+)
MISAPPGPQERAVPLLGAGSMGVGPTGLPDDRRGPQEQLPASDGWGSYVKGFVKENPKAVCGSGCCCFLIVFVLIVISLSALQPIEYGLKYNRLTKQIDKSNVYHGGRHFINPLNTFLRFPATTQNLEFSNTSKLARPLSTRTAEGLELSLSVAFQYKLMQEHVGDLYALANVYYEPLFVKVVRETLLVAAADYVAQAYWKQRAEVGLAMLDQVNKSLQHSYAYCTGLQLLNIDLPDSYEQSIVTTQVQTQNVSTTQNAQQAALIRAQIGVLVANYTNKVTVILSTANASAKLVTKLAEAEASQMKIEAENRMFKEVKDNLKLSENGLVRYQEQYSLSVLPNASFLFGVPNAVSVVKMAAPSYAAAAAAVVASGGKKK